MRNKMKKVKGLLFDFNGTLFFDSKMHISIFQEYFAEHGKMPPSAEFVVKNIFGTSNSHIYSTYFAKDENDNNWESFAEDKEGRYRQFCLDHPEQMKYTDGVDEFFDYLKQNGIPYAIATGTGLDNVEFYFEKMNLGRWFTMDNIVYSDGTYPGKPEPDIWQIAAKKIGLDVTECAVFEDGTNGIIAAHKADAASVVCVYDHDLPSPLVDGLTADRVYPDFTKWKEMLEYLGFEVK